MRFSASFYVLARGPGRKSGQNEWKNGFSGGKHAAERFLLFGNPIY
jgi:hypothetical protein